jgi:predicted Zn-dependent protease
VYDPNGSLTIDLVYDKRQQNTEQNAVLKANVERVSQLASSVRAQYGSLEDQFKASSQAYESELAIFGKDQEKYNADVAYWNSRGGAPHAQYQVLASEKNNLQVEYANLEQKRVEVNNLSTQINAFIKQYNLLIAGENSTIQSINKNAGEFEEGLYDPNTNTVTIYQFDTKERLFRVLAHELGHSLGLDHNDNSKSIMYAYNIDQNDVLTVEDLTALLKVCSAK